MQNNHIELLRAICKLIDSPLGTELEIVEVLQMLARGAFGFMLNDDQIKNFGGNKEVRKMSQELLVINQLLTHSNNKNKKNEKTSKK